MNERIVPVYHQQIIRGQLAGCYVLIPFHPSVPAVNAAIDEQERLLKAGATIVSFRNGPTEPMRLVA